MDDRLYLNAGADRRLKRGHLWLYSNEIDVGKTPLSALPAGSQAAVCDARGRFLAWAHINPHTLLCGKVVSFVQAQPFGRELLRLRLQRALALRQGLFAEACYRLVYGEADGLPGLIVDRFFDVLVVQIHSQGMENNRQLIVEELSHLLAPAGILLRNDHTSRALEGLPQYVEIADGDVPAWAPLVENGVRFEAPLLEGQKTGWFYDHRPNRARLQGMVSGKRVLDVFSYVGAWGIQAAAVGAREVLCIDSSPLALEGVARNAALNGCGERVSTRQGKATEVMKELIDSGERFDVVVLDPPAFIKKRKDLAAGETAYHQCNALALRLLADQGLLVSASCSMLLAEEKLVDIVRGAGWQRRSQTLLLSRGEQGMDHPQHPAIAETRYLKCLFAQIWHNLV